MKKLLALFLAILMIATVALVSCNNNKGTTGNNNDDEAETTPEDNGGLVIPDNIQSSETTGDDSESTETSDKPANNDPNGGFEDVTQFSVYTYTKTKIRSSAKISANVVTTVEPSSTLVVVAKRDTEGNQWYKVKYGTSEGYVPQDFVTLNKDDTTFTELDEADQKTIKIKANTDSSSDPYKVNIRQYPIVSDYLTEQEVVTLTSAETANGELVKIGESTSGLWYKVAYNGKTFYLKISSTTRPYLLVDDEPLDNNQGGI